MLLTKEEYSHQWSGESIDPQVLNNVIDILKAEYGVTDPKFLGLLGSSLSELILNIKHHAYEADESNKWAIQLQAKGENCFVVSVRDYGKSIPVTVLEVPTIDNVQYISDSALIDKAVHSKGDSVHLGRGQGLHSICRLVENNTYRSLQIKSRNGVLAQTFEGTTALLVTPKELVGTLVELSFECKEFTK